jgi:hypothetical protein
LSPAADNFPALVQHLPKEFAMASMFWKRPWSRADRRQAPKRQMIFARPRLELLEDRTLLTVTAKLANQVLTVVANNNGTTQAQILLQSSNILVMDGAQQVGDPIPVGNVKNIQFGDNPFSVNIPVSGSQLTLGSVTISQATFSLGANSLSLNAAVVVPNLPAFNVSGQINTNGFTLRGSASNIPLGGFTVSPQFTLTEDSLEVNVGVNIPSLNTTAQFSGAISGDGSYQLTGAVKTRVAGFPVSAVLYLAPTGVTGTIQLGVLGGVALLRGSISGGTFTLRGYMDATVGDFNIRPSFVFTPGSLQAAVKLDLPNLGTSVSVGGSINAQGRFSLTGQGTFNVGGMKLSPSFTLTNIGPSPSLQVACDGVNLPVVGTASFDGTINTSGQFSITSTLGSVPVLGLTLSNVRATLTNNPSWSLSVGADVTGLPEWINGVQFNGTVGGGQLALTFDVGHLGLWGLSVDKLHTSLTDKQIHLEADMSGVPVIGGFHITGDNGPNGFKISAEKKGVQLTNWLPACDVALTLNKTNLELTAITNVQPVGEVTFKGELGNGQFTISAAGPNFTMLGGLLTLKSPTVKLTLSPTNQSVSISTGADLSIAGQPAATATITGTVTGAGSFSFSGSASLTIAGFSLGNVQFQFGSGSSGNQLTIPSFGVTFPVIGRINISGSYGPASGQFSFLTTWTPPAPIWVGPVPLTSFTVGLSNTSLTLGTSIGIKLGDLDAGSVGLKGTIYTPSDGRGFELEGTVNALSIGKFAGASAKVVVTPQGVTLDANVNYFIARANVHGSLNFSTKTFDLVGTANVEVAGISLSQTRFEATNAGGTLVVSLHSQTGIDGFGPAVVFDGTLATTDGTNFTIDVKATATLTVAGFTLAGAKLELTNSKLSVEVGLHLPGIFDADFMGWWVNKNKYDLKADASLHFGDFTIGQGHLRLNSDKLEASGSLQIPGFSMDFAGYYYATGQYQLTANAKFNALLGFATANGTFTLTNSGLSFACSVRVLTVSASLAGNFDANGKYDLTGTASFTLFGFSLANFSLDLNNRSGGTSMRMSGNIKVVFVGMNFDGQVNPDGSYNLTAMATGPWLAILGVRAQLTFNNVSCPTSDNVGRLKS